MQKLSNNICRNYVPMKQPFQVVSHIRAVYLKSQIQELRRPHSGQISSPLTAVSTDNYVK